MRYVCVFFFVAMVMATVPAAAEIPHLIRYQGQAVDTNGVPLEGPYTLTFRLYDVETAGIHLWEEIQPNVPLSKGHFSVLLGSVKPLSAMDWSRPCWLGVQVNGESELAPRQQITSVPLAIRAKTAEVVKTSGLTDDTNSLVPSGAIILWNSTACPSGYTRFTAIDDKFVVSGATYQAAAGGSSAPRDISHAHSAGSYTAPNHTHGAGSYAVAPTTTNGGGCCAGGLSNPPATTPVSGTSAGSGALTISGTSGVGGPASLDIRPAFATILLCQKN